MIDLLKKLTGIPAPSGNEDRLSELIRQELTPYCDEVYNDVLGNLIARKKGAGKKLMLTAHMDEVGVLVTYIEKNGFLRFAAIGHLSPYNALNRRIEFQNGVFGIISCGEKQDLKELKISDMFIDIGAKDEKEAQEKIAIGTPGVLTGELVEIGNNITSRALDDRIGCALLILAIRLIEKPQNDLYFVFSVQEELGMRGAKTASYGVEPDYAISVDVTRTGDLPNGNRMQVELGKGAAIKVRDSSITAHPYIKALLIEAARENNIPYQLEILESGGSDAGAIHLTKNGIPTGGISIPTRYLHSAVETINSQDAKDVLALICAVINKGLK